VVMMRPRPAWPMTRRMSASSTSASLVVRPGDFTLVLSLISSATPSFPGARDGFTVRLQTSVLIMLAAVPFIVSCTEW